jgi:hypothetical protein
VAWQYPNAQARVIIDDITVTPAIRGEWLFVVESEFVDGTIHTDKVIARVQYKNPETTIDISDVITAPIVGLDFDADQQLWVLTDDDFYHRLKFHKDIALVDYDNKIIYLHEDYRDLKVTT